MKTELKEHVIVHPAEQIFDIAPGTTVVDRVEQVEELPSIPATTYDEKDMEIDDQLQTIFNAGMTAYEAQRLSTEGMNPQFANRALEVAAQFLNTALAAVNSKAQFKQSKDKIAKTPSSTTNNTTNNTVIMDRNEMLQMLLAQQREAQQNDSSKIIENQAEQNSA